jgi:hypothetical protein
VIDSPRFLVAVLIVAIVASPLSGNNIPNGLSPIFKGIEPGKPFHPIWPPIVGQTLVGTVVVAKNVKQPEAYFGSIEGFRSSAYTGQFKIEQLGYVAPTLTQSHDVGVDAAFTQLDAIASAAKKGANASSLNGKSVEQNGTEKPSDKGPAKTTSDPTSLLGSNPATTCGVDNPKANNASTGKAEPAKASDASKQTNGKSAGKSDNASGNGQSQPTTKKTGIDFSRMSSAQVQICGLAVVYYTPQTLQDIASKNALTDAGNDLLTDSQRGWIVNRALVATSMEYTLVSSTSLDAGFFAKLTAWLPGVSIRYKGANTVTIRTTSPLTIGYKLWRPGLSITGAGADESKPENIGRGGKEIDDILDGKIH